jgi:hypothetical protein
MENLSGMFIFQTNKNYLDVFIKKQKRTYNFYSTVHIILIVFIMFMLIYYMFRLYFCIIIRWYTLLNMYHVNCPAIHSTTICAPKRIPTDLCRMQRKGCIDKENLLKSSRKHEMPDGRGYKLVVRS